MQALFMSTLTTMFVSRQLLRSLHNIIIMNLAPMVPFGGIKNAGFGRENGQAAIEHYSQIKSFFVNTGPIENPFE